MVFFVHLLLPLQVIFLKSFTCKNEAHVVTSNKKYKTPRAHKIKYVISGHVLRILMITCTEKSNVIFSENHDGDKILKRSPYELGPSR